MSGPATISLFVTDHMADTQHLTIDEYGAHTKLLFCAWRSQGCELLKDDRRLATMIGVTPGRWAKLKPAVMELWTETETGWQRESLTKQRDFAEEKSAKNSLAARASHEARGLKNKEVRPANATTNALPPNHPTLSLRENSNQPPIPDSARAAFDAVCKVAGMSVAEARAPDELARLVGWLDGWNDFELERDLLEPVRAMMRERPGQTNSLVRFEKAVLYRKAAARVKPAATEAPADPEPPAIVGDELDDFRQSLHRAFGGRTWGVWFGKSSIFQRERELVIDAGSPFVAEYIRTNFETKIGDVAALCGLERDLVIEGSR